MSTEPADLDLVDAAQPGTTPSEFHADLVCAVLIGGPAGFPHGERRRRRPPDEATVKVEFYGGHEHFERDEGSAGQCPVVYRWTTRTRIAE